MKSMSREEQLECWRRRYQARGLPGKVQLLDELCEEYGYHRKHAIRLLNGVKTLRKSPPGPQPRYEAIVEVVQRILIAGEQPCGKRLLPMLSLWLPYYQKRYGKLLPSQRRLADEVSAATLDRLLGPVRAQTSLRGLCGTKPGSLLRQQIPIQGEVWDERRPGFLEADSCGALWQQSGWQLYLESDFHRPGQQLDLWPGGMEPWCQRGFGANPPGGATTAICVVGAGY